jgi:cytoskeletal protein RodZ
MKSKIAKPIFFIFLLLTFLAGWYFYVVNAKTPYMEYMENMEPSVQPEAKPEEEPEEEEPEEEEPEENKVIEVQDASRDSKIYNTNMYAGFDPTSQYVGVYTNLDQIHQSTSFSELSENPMDANWGGVLYTKEAVDSGKYDENLVVPYGHDPKRGVGISTSIHAGNGEMKSVFA